MSRWIRDHLKNLPGWRTARKLVVFSVDDYGNVRLDSKRARENLDRAGLKCHSRYDALDTLETRQDLEQLFDVLLSVRDSHGHPAVFTPFALPCNIDFEGMAEEGNHAYRYELLPRTFEKLSVFQPEAYSGAWDLWKEGMSQGLWTPQFHGREHLNLKVVEEKLSARDKELLISLANRSLTSLSGSGHATIKYTAAFEFWDITENDRFREIIKDGLDQFALVFGERAVQFNPPGGREHRVIHQVLQEGGIRYIDAEFIRSEHQGQGKYRRKVTWTGQQNGSGMYHQVRNVVFEPTHDRGVDWVNLALKQIEAAFRFRKPAIISSHRVNFCGHIDPANRNDGLTALKLLLEKIVSRWPEVEFVTANTAMDILVRENTSSHNNGTG